MVSLLLFDGVNYRLDESVNFFMTTEEVNGVIVWQAVNQRTGDDLTLTFAGGLPHLGNLELSSLPGPGDYIWTASLSLPDQPDLCVRSGEFTVVGETLLEQIREGQVEAATPTDGGDN